MYPGHLVARVNPGEISESDSMQLYLTMPLDTWHYVSATFDGMTLTAYVDGVSVGSTSGEVAIEYWDTALWLGKRCYTTEGLSGLMEEERLSSVARSPEWIAFEYDNIYQSGHEVTWGGEETLLMVSPTPAATGTGLLGSGDVTIAAGASLVFNRGDHVSVGLCLHGAGSVAQSGSGKLTLTGQSDYTGGTTLNAGELEITGSTGRGPLTLNGGTLDFNLTDTGGDQFLATGGVNLHGGTLNVTSSRANSYGVVRVLIEKDGSSPVSEPFAGLAEGDEITVDSVTYWITYQYNAEAATFGDANDVALVSSLFSDSWVKSTYPIWLASPDVMQHALDAGVGIHYTDKTADQYQLTEHLSQYDPDWAAGGPDFSYESLDTAVATVDNAGLVQFVATGSCSIVVTATEDGHDDQTFAINLSGATYGGDVISTYVPDAITPENVGDYVLVLYNADSMGGDVDNVISSTALMEYYRANRPGMWGANYLGITGVNEATYVCATQCDSLVTQVLDWLEDNPTKPIRYIVALRGLPSRESDSYGVEGPSVSYMIYSQLLEASGKAGYLGGTHRFSVAEYGAPLISWLNCGLDTGVEGCGSYDATVAYINREIVVAAAGGLQSDGITISGMRGGRRRQHLLHGRHSQHFQPRLLRLGYLLRRLLRDS